MTACVPCPKMTVLGTGTGRIPPAFLYRIGAFRLPTDPLFYADLTLENIAVGSRYRVTRDSDGAELATGVASSTTEVISGVAVYSSAMLVKITVRKGTTAPKYEPLDAYAYMERGGASAYISQIPDPIA